LTKNTATFGGRRVHRGWGKPMVCEGKDVTGEGVGEGVETPTGEEGRPKWRHSLRGRERVYIILERPKGGNLIVTGGDGCPTATTIN